MGDDELLARSEAYLDRLFGPGMGARHGRFLEHLRSPELRETLHRYHAWEDDESRLTVEENYLIGMCVLCALRSFEPAKMFACTLLHRGVSREKILEAAARLSMWTGGIPAAEAAAHIQRAIRDYEKHGLQAMKQWFPDE